MLANPYPGSGIRLVGTLVDRGRLRTAQAVSAPTCVARERVPELETGHLAVVLDQSGRGPFDAERRHRTATGRGAELGP